MSDDSLSQISSFNQSFKEYDGIYHAYAKQCAIPDSTLMILYSLRERGEPYPQRELCSDWFYSPQTVNSALKTLETRGLVELNFADGNRKSKLVSLTSSGTELAEKIIDPLMRAEQSAFYSLEESEQKLLTGLLQKYNSLLKRETANI